MKVLKISSYALASAIIVFAYQNCSRPKFSVDQSQKVDTVQNTPVFDRDPGIDPVTDGDRDPGVDPTATTVTFTYKCSDRGTQNANMNLLKSEALKLVVTDTKGKVICEMNGDFRTELLNTKSLILKQVCGSLSAGSYQAYLVDTKSEDFVEANLIYPQDNVMAPVPLKFSVNSSGVIELTKKSKSSLSKKKSMYTLLYDANTKGVNKSLAYDDEDPCDDRQSPLVIHLGSKVAKGIELSAPLDGILFDILGERSYPVAHTPKQISWFKRQDHEYYYIVKPNLQGHVTGINEMFGNNTRGPDGKFAKNGYKALAKFDDDGDGLITDNDSIYYVLRLWKDENLDGIAQDSELYTLDEKQIELIDLDYDSRFKETDIYGNQTMMKSIVKTKDGEMHLMFDLWFRYLNISK